MNPLKRYVLNWETLLLWKHSPASNNALEIQPSEQEQDIYGDEDSRRPSHLMMLCDGHNMYRDFYEHKQMIATNKSSDTNNTFQIVLKQTFSRDKNRRYHAITDMKWSTLEKSLQTQKYLLQVAPCLYMHRLV